MKINDATARYEMRLEKNTRKSDERRVQEDTQHKCLPTSLRPRVDDGGTAGRRAGAGKVFNSFRDSDRTTVPIYIMYL